MVFSTKLLRRRPDSFAAAARLPRVSHHSSKLSRTIKPTPSMADTKYPNDALRINAGA